jgi:hypothetical protein
MILKNQIVKIKPEFMDSGDEEFTWITVSDEEKGRVDITYFPCNLRIKPIQTVRTEWLEF